MEVNLSPMGDVPAGIEDLPKNEKKASTAQSLSFSVANLLAVEPNTMKKPSAYPNLYSFDLRRLSRFQLLANEMQIDRGKKQSTVIWFS